MVAGAFAMTSFWSSTGEEFEQGLEGLNGTGPTGRGTIQLYGHARRRRVGYGVGPPKLERAGGLPDARRYFGTRGVRGRMLGHVGTQELA